MRNIFYILILKNKEAFKVGISRNEDLSRIKQLSRIYNFNFNDSYLVTANTFKTIKQLEAQIKSDYIQHKHITKEKSDGFSEFINYEQLPNILDEIKYKSRLLNLGIIIQKGIEFINNPIPINNTPNLTKIIENQNHFFDFQLLENIVYQIIKNKKRIKYYSYKKNKCLTGMILTYDTNLTNKIFNYRVLENAENEYGNAFIKHVKFEKFNLNLITMVPVAKVYKNLVLNVNGDTKIERFEKSDFKFNAKLAEINSIFRRVLRKPSENEIQIINSTLDKDT